MHKDLIDILTIEIPETKPRPDGFLDVISQGYMENTISCIYSYFLDASKNKSIADLFLNSLQEIIIGQCNKELIIDVYDCLLEVGTNKGNRIDIVIDAKENKEAIIIENKIHHTLNNDLLDYWQSYKYPEKNKVGVLLTLHKTEIPLNVKGKFINITHAEWIEKIKQNGLPSNLSVKEYVYLGDFIKNIEDLSINKTMNEQTSFFFEHTNRVLKAIDIYKEAELYIINQLKITAEKIGWKCSGHAYTSRWIWDGKNDYYYTIQYENLLNNKENSITVIIEFYRKLVNELDDLKLELANNGIYQVLKHSEGAASKNVHFVKKEYHVSEEELNNLGDFLYSIIEKDFEPIMKDIIRYIENKKSLLS